MHTRLDRTSLPRAVFCAVSIAMAGALLSACAPDAFSNRRASGFNQYLRTIGTACNPLQIGNSDVGEWLRELASSDPNYSYFLDMTSKLYYRRITPDEYKVGVTGFLGPGSSNERSFACMFNNLPPDRPSAPPTPY